MTRYKININRPDVTHDEIVEKRDFNVVLKKYTRDKRKIIKNNWLVIYILILVILFSVFLAVKILDDHHQKSKGNKKSLNTEIKHNIGTRSIPT